ncbi:MAG: methyltransferase type 11, partial [Bacteroidetes bacterium]|nr:methyltransferase type 11 [Bacteroidota bacterium]
FLESRFRLLVQNPRKILKKHIQPNMTVLDLGCGTGYFTLEIVTLLYNKGKVIATDIQKGMLDILKQKIINSDLQKQIQIHNNQENSLNLTEKVDFILAFYSFHEMKYIDNIISDLAKISTSETKILISEQRFHVSKYMFNSIIQKLTNCGFEICERPWIFLSRTVIMKINNQLTQ